jgi:L-lactate dehydrogenase complex protein LldG
MDSREAIRSAIRDALRRPRPAELVPRLDQARPPAPALKTGLDRFREVFAELRGEYAEAGSAAEVAAYLERLVAAKPLRRVHATAAPLLDRLGARETLRRLGVLVESPYLPRDPGAHPRPADLDALVTGVDLVLAETATLVHLAKPGEGRMTTLTAPVHVALFTDDQVVETLEDVLARFAGVIAAGDRSCLTFITGPSRTADIEKQLFIGVHGPGELLAVRVGAGSQTSSSRSNA